MSRHFILPALLSVLLSLSCKSTVPPETEPTEDPVSADPVETVDPESEDPSSDDPVSEDPSVEPSIDPEWKDTLLDGSLDPFTPGEAVAQVSISRIDDMPSIPSTYKMLDWRQKALDYDAYVFDWNRTDGIGPLIWLDDTHKNFDRDGFGLYTTVGDARQGPDKPAGHEAINTIAAVMSGALMGIDKTSQDGYNYAIMVQNYFAVKNLWNIMLNGTSGYGTDWWYNVLPNLLYYAVGDLCPSVEGTDEILRSIAEKFAAADLALKGDYSWSWFNYATLRGFKNGIPAQQDAAAGHAWVLLNAFRHFGDESYVTRAVSAMTALASLSDSRFYEILMPFGAYCAAYLNARFGQHFDVPKILSWSFDSSKGRWGWGVICDRWGDYDVYGLQGSITDGGGYAFQMNCYEMAWPLVPMVKYDPSLAAAIGKWMLNNASASRLFFPYEIDDEHQACADIKDITGNVIGYEGLRKTDRYGRISAVPVAEGDGPSWTSSNPPSTMFSLYSTSPIGIFGSIISTTDVEGVLSLDCNATDFYADRPFPCHLLYNPYDAPTVVTYNPSGSAAYDLFDAVKKDYAATSQAGPAQVEIPAGGAVLLYELPAGEQLYCAAGRICTASRDILCW